MKKHRLRLKKRTVSAEERAAEAIRLNRGHTDPIVRSLSNRCSRWGGKLVRLQTADFRRLIKSEAPFTEKDLGVIWEHKIVAYAGKVNWSEVIHEMGHVFASPVPPDHRECEEFSWLGWEMALAKRIGNIDTWLANNKDYVVGGPPWDEENAPIMDDIGSLTPLQKIELVANRINLAMQTGLLSPRGTPIPIR